MIGGSSDGDLDRSRYKPKLTAYNLLTRGMSPIILHLRPNQPLKPETRSPLTRKERRSDSGTPNPLLLLHSPISTPFSSSHPEMLSSPPSPLPFKPFKPSSSSLSPFPSFPLPFPHHRRRRPLLCRTLSSANPNPNNPNTNSSSGPIQSVLYPTITDPASTHLPGVRTYESDLAVLSLTGTVTADQAVAAAAADGGNAAEEHLSDGAEAMVVETVFPGGPPDGNCTISTKLFLPAKKVKERAKMIKKGAGFDTQSGSKNNILPVTFRQVVMDRLWSFSLTVLAPGSERNTDDLTAPREVKADFTVSSSDANFLSSLSEAVCMFMIENIRTRNKNSCVKNSSLDLSISIHTVAEEDMVNYVMKKPEILNLVEKGKPPRSYLWEPPSYRMLEKVCGREIIDRMHWFIPAYRLQVVLNAFRELKLEGWHEVAENRWEVLLTHFQMMELANVLDMYYEDQYTLPGKKLSCRPILEPINPTSNADSFLKVLLVTITGLFVISLIGIGARVFGAHLSKHKVHSQENFSVPLSEKNSGAIYCTNTVVLEEACKSVVRKIKDSLGFSGEIMFSSNVGAWVGTVPSYLEGTDPMNKDLRNYDAEDISNEPDDLKKKEPAIQDTAQDIASFQVVLSEQGDIVGFQPTSRVAVGIWSSHPLAKELYKGRKLSPGILEPSLKIPHPQKVVLIELLMSTNPDSFFALARPIREHSELVLAKG